MKLKDLEESSPSTFRGSITPDLLTSKVWLTKELKKYEPLGTIYILGSWYGNTAWILNQHDLQFKKIINVDINSKWLDFSDKLLRQAGIDNLQSMKKDVNKLDYRQLGARGVVINTSIQDIKGNQWFENIPRGALVVLQDRDNTQSSQHHTENEFDRAYPLTKTLYLGSKHLSDPETDYTRWMKIGIK